jgi:Uma2 family endonuclease
MTQSLRWTSADLEAFPDDGRRYEIIDGKLYVSRQPHFYHQVTCSTVTARLFAWNEETGAGVVSEAPGLIFAEDDDVAPDIVWISRERLRTSLRSDGKLHAAPDLVVEVLSPGAKNERRDREAKLRLYSRRGVLEYWIVSWQRREVEVYRRSELALQLVATLLENNTLESPLLHGFSCPVSKLFASVPTGAVQEVDEQ